MPFGYDDLLLVAKRELKFHGLYCLGDIAHLGGKGQHVVQEYRISVRNILGVDNHFLRREQHPDEIRDKAIQDIAVHDALLEAFARGKVRLCVQRVIVPAARLKSMIHFVRYDELMTIFPVKEAQIHSVKTGLFGGNGIKHLAHVLPRKNLLRCELNLEMLLDGDDEANVRQ